MGSSKSCSNKTPPSKSSKIKSKKETKSKAASSSLSPPQPQQIEDFTGPILILDTGGDTIKHKLIPSTSNLPSSTHSTSSTAAAATIVPTSTPNVTGKPKHQLTTLIADEINTIKQQNQLKLSRPIERGYIVDLGLQYLIWKRIICDLEHLNVILPGAASLLAAVAAATGGGGKKKKKKRKRSEEEDDDEKTLTSTTSTVPTSKCCIFHLTQPNTPKVITENVDQVFYHDFNFGFVLKRLVQCCSAYHYFYLLENNKERETLDNKGEEHVDEKEENQHKENEKNVHFNFRPTDLKTWKNDNTKCCCVVDSGFSFTHVVPTINAHPVQKAIRRLNIGGKILTNLLKEQISYRQWNMMDDYAIVNNVKESTCFITTKFDNLMKYASKTKKGLRYFDVNYVLPDFVHSFKGRVELPLLLQRKMEWEEKQLKKGLLEEKGGDEENMKNDSKVEDVKKPEKSCDDEHSKEDENKKEKKSKNGGGENKGNDRSKSDTKETKKEEDNDDNNDDAEDSDEETQEQKLLRLQKQRQKELEHQKNIQEQEQQSLFMSVERFAIPEVLFRPSDLGLPRNICGLSELIVQAIQACDDELRAAMYHNILLTGGNANIPGFKERVEMEVRSLAPDNYAVRVFLPEDPVNFAWQGAHEYAKCKEFVNENCESKTHWEASKDLERKQALSSKATAPEEEDFLNGMIVR